MTAQQRTSFDNERGIYAIRDMAVPAWRIAQIEETPDEPANPYAGDSVLGTKYGAAWFPRAG